MKKDTQYSERYSISKQTRTLPLWVCYFPLKFWANFPMKARETSVILAIVSLHQYENGTTKSHFLPSDFLCTRYLPRTGVWFTISKHRLNIFLHLSFWVWVFLFRVETRCDDVVVVPKHIIYMTFIVRQYSSWTNQSLEYDLSRKVRL